MMKQRNPLATALLYTFVPFYSVYWLYITCRDLYSRGIKAPSPKFLVWFFLSPFLAAIVLIVMLVSITYTANDTLLGLSLAFFALLLYFFVYFVVGIWIIVKLSQAINTYTNGRADAVLLIVFFLLLSPVAVYIAQQSLNFINIAQNPFQQNGQFAQPSLPQPPKEPDTF